MPEERLLFLSMARQRLLHQLMSGWHRRGASLLQIGLNANVSPAFFWEAGFDVTAVDPSPSSLAEAAAHTGPRVEYVQGHADDLPFEDASFDYAVLMHQGVRSCNEKKGFLRSLFSERGSVRKGLEPDEGHPALREALRVASRGVLLLEWNRFSLAGEPSALHALSTGMSGDEGVLRDRQYVPRADRTKEVFGEVWPWELYALARRCSGGRRLLLMSVLPLWQGTWPAGGKGWKSTLQHRLSPLNLTPLPLPVGALLGMRIDWASAPVTPVGMLRHAASRLCPGHDPVLDARRGALRKE